MSELDAFTLARALAEREARCLDLRIWDEWLSLFAEDSVFWVPTYRADGELADDPRTQVSHIFYDRRSALQDRIERVRSPHSVASVPLARTAHHQTGFVALEPPADGRVRIECSWSTHIYFPLKRTQHVLFGRQQYEIETNLGSGDAIIRAKKVILFNEVIPTMADIYCF